jgi:4-hydroxythreonine-4-phosphate dehydrogenase
MAFWGKKFSVALLTDHLPLSAVASSLTKESLETVIQNCLKSAFFLSSQKKASIGVLGLNPHAGEIEGLGKEEIEVIIPVLESFKNSKIAVQGPLVPDICFHDPDYKKHSIYIAMYHDQGLIPFKIYHKKNHGVQISLNAPFVRTSVDHGTAKDIFGKRKADPTSMILAIQKAFEMLD